MENVICDALQIWWWPTYTRWQLCNNPKSTIQGGCCDSFLRYWKKCMLNILLFYNFINIIDLRKRYQNIYVNKLEKLQKNLVYFQN